MIYNKIREQKALNVYRTEQVVTPSGHQQTSSDGSPLAGQLKCLCFN